MIKKINISENDRRTILSMHKLIVEQSGEITIRGTVTEDEEKNVPSPYLKVKLRNSSNEIVGQAETDENGHYIMTGLTLPIGEYTLTFGNDESSEVVNIESNTISPITVDSKLKTQEMPQSVIMGKGYRSPIFNVNVLNSNGENIEGAKIEIYYKLKSINYKTFVGEFEATENGNNVSTNTKVDSNNKITSSDGLKNIWIDSKDYQDFKSEKTDVLCSNKLPIKIVVNYKGRKKSLSVDICINNCTYQITPETKQLRVAIKEPQDFTLTMGVNTTLKITVVDKETKEKVGPGSIDLYNDLNKEEPIGSVTISDKGTGQTFLGLDGYDRLVTSETGDDISPLTKGRHRIVLHSLESGYDEFFKSYLITINSGDKIKNITVEIDHVEKDNESEEDTPFKKGSTIRVFYGKSINSPDETQAVENAKKDAFEQFLNKSNEYNGSTELRGKTPDGGKLVSLKNHNDGTYSAVVVYKRGELRTFAKNNIQKEVTTQVEEQTNINFSDVKINEAINNTESKSSFIFVLGNDPSSTELYNNIISNKELLTIINRDYINVKISPDTTNEDYLLLYNTYGLRYYPSLYLFVDKKPYGFGDNNNGSIYLQLQNYFKV